MTTQIINSNGQLLRPGNTYLFKSSVGALNATVAFASNPDTDGIRLVDIDGDAGINNITLTTQQGNKFFYGNQVDPVLIIDVGAINGQIVFDATDSLWSVFPF